MQLSTYNLSQSVLARGLIWSRRPTADIAWLDASTWADSPDLALLPAPEEQQAADQLPDGEDRHHFLRRRLFQRLFVAKLLAFEGPVNQLPLVHIRDKRPSCPLLPDLCLTFSSAGNNLVAAASRSHSIGIDVERLRSVANVTALAARFLAPQEAAALNELPASDREATFIRIWSAKEACLKAFGTGVIAGPELFQFTFAGNALRMQQGPPGWRMQDWSLEELPAPGGHVAYLSGYYPR